MFVLNGMLMQLSSLKANFLRRKLAEMLGVNKT